MPLVVSTYHAQILVSKYHSPLKGFLGKWLRAGLGQRRPKMSMNHSEGPESKKVPQELWGHTRGHSSQGAPTSPIRDDLNIEILIKVC